MKARKEMHGDRVAAGTYICPYCLASNSATVPELDYRDFRPSALFRSMRVSHASYVRSGAGSPWMDVPGFSWDRATLDNMHILFHDGFVGDCIATALVDLCAESFFHETKMEVALYRASEHLKAWQRTQTACELDTRHSIGAFTLSLLHYKPSAGPPHLSSTFKCGHVRIMLFWMASVVCSRSVSAADRYTEVRALFFILCASM
jgi:hypothetical protein